MKLALCLMLLVSNLAFADCDSKLLFKYDTCVQKSNGLDPSDSECIAAGVEVIICLATAYNAPQDYARFQKEIDRLNRKIRRLKAKLAR